MQPKLLVIDDSHDIHSLLEVRLRPEGLRVHHAHDGEQGVKMTEALLPDVILLDVEMPEVSGFDVCRRLKADPRTSGIPIIFLTGASDVDTKVHGFDLGAVDYVTKPFEPAELRARVRAALRTKRYQDLLETRASIDGLTGLSTRRCFDERLAAEVQLANVERRSLSLVMLDVDHFKSLNDTYGHPFGDRVLQSLG
ncbi:MAG TPA: response regulator, partial [Byssovorax sp.]